MEENRCHQCFKKDKRWNIFCNTCKNSNYCRPCTRKWYPHLFIDKDAVEECPLCCKICSCGNCLKNKGFIETSKTNLTNFERRHQLENLIASMLPFLNELIEAQKHEIEVEAKIRGVPPGEVEATLTSRERVYCHHCQTSILDLHQHCPNPECGYDLCLKCCQEFRKGFLSPQPEISEYRDRGAAYMHASHSGRIFCGCGTGILELTRILPLTWMSDLKQKADNFMASYKETPRLLNCSCPGLETDMNRNAASMNNHGSHDVSMMIKKTLIFAVDEAFKELKKLNFNVYCRREKKMLTKTNMDSGFPMRLYSLGCEPECAKSLNYHSKTKFLNQVKQAVGEEVWNRICSTPLGVIARFVSNKFIWSSKVVKKLLVKQLVCNKKYEIWCLFGSTPARFSLSEFEYITGLNCAPLPDKDDEELDVGGSAHKDLWGKMGLDKVSDNPSKSNLVKVLKDVPTWSDEDKTRYAYLSILATIIKGGDGGTQLCKRARMVFDLPKFEGYPWGRLAFKTLIGSVKRAVLEGDSITIHGFLQVLQIWMYNLFPNLGRQYGNPSATESLPLLKFKGKKWFGNRDIDQILVDDEVNIENAFINNSEPTVWDDDNADKKIDALVQAICKGGLGAVTWMEEGLKSASKKNITASIVGVDGGGEAGEGGGDSGQMVVGDDCVERNHGKKKRKKMSKTYTEKEWYKLLLREALKPGGEELRLTRGEWNQLLMRRIIVNENL